MPKTETDSTPIIVGKTYDFVLWLLPKVEKFPRSYRFTVGERLTGNGLDLLMLLVEAAYTQSKEDLLEQASRKVNGTRYLIRLAKDLHLLSLEAYEFAATNLDEIGRMVGGWRKAGGRKA